ncbi:type IV pilus modification protein PilV [Variovorax atrisoli]|uniref:type IV pilus modification protein PilV n=1 Tax=Variovorax atrisoli TaxID=3394203 RepID=UPI00119C49EB|nr:type IV pilus modification protein PilV [Variovorax paradoxus]MDR6520262.1 type IV pilus assembly protein PilV [Variovorax paradoxus]
MMFRARQSGVALIEALVALLVFSLGLVAIASLLAVALKYQTGNEARLNVSAVIDDLSERIRVNAPGANGYSGVGVEGKGYLLTDAYSEQVAEVVTEPAKDCASAVCTPAELAVFDLARWKNTLRAALPGGAGYVTGDVRAGFDVSVMWFDKGAVDEKGDALEQAACTKKKEDLQTGSARFCCPEGAKAPAGVRCYTARVLP